MIVDRYMMEWVDNQNCFGINYPISRGLLANLINEVMGKKVGDVRLWDWDEVVKQLEIVYTA